jgi:type II secretory pathway pseudopilin PulG
MCRTNPKSKIQNPRSIRGQTLVATLLVLVIIAILAVVMLRGSNTFGMGGKEEKGRPDGRGGTMPGLVKARAEDTVCQSNLQQIRMAIQMQRTTNDEPPARLEDTKIGENFYKCPLGGERYQYDAATGKVFCPHLGHEKF